MDIQLPRNLVEYAAARERTDWIAALPATIARACRELQINRLDPPFQPGGQTAWVAPAGSQRHGECVLKVAFRHHEALDEANGLREWDGAGAVRLLAAREQDEYTSVLLLERCSPGSWLADEPAATQDRVLAGILARLRREPSRPGLFRPLREMCDLWTASSERWADRHRERLDLGLIAAGTELFRALPRDATPQVLLATDLHAENVLAAEREPWLMIDPKPYVGDPAYDPLQHILNGAARFGRDPLRMAERMAELLDLDGERVRHWLFARCVVGAADWPELLDIARRVGPKL